MNRACMLVFFFFKTMKPRAWRFDLVLGRYESLPHKSGVKYYFIQYCITYGMQM